MTQDEFNKTAFRKGDKVRVNIGTFEVVILDRTPKQMPIFAGDRWWTLDEIKEYIPVQIGIEQIIEKQESEYYKQEQASFWKDVYLTALDQPEIKAADDCTNWADQALEDYKQRFKL